ncbi:MAG: hypothetical protein AABY93_02410 [Bacteroidota bacterium]
MKAKIKTTLAIAGIAIALVAASQSVNPVAHKNEMKVNAKPAFPCYSEYEVIYLMTLNQWPRQTAVEVLDLSCQSAQHSEKSTGD